MYVRPELPALVFVDSAGEPIPYGDRWGDDGPPERTYSRTRHPERFEPLIGVSRALVDHLAATYDVDVEISDGLPDDAPGTIREFEHGQIHVVRTTTVIPRHGLCAPLVVAETTFPSVVVAMGAVGIERAPSCGCDACDESLTDAAAQLEHLVFTVANGGYQERYSWSEGIEIITAGDGGAGYSRVPRHAADKERVEALKQSQRLRHGERWMPWPARRDDAEGTWDEAVDEARRRGRVLARSEHEAAIQQALERIKRRLRRGSISSV